MPPRAGAACSSSHALPDDVPADVPVVLVEDTTRALGRLAAYHRAPLRDPASWRSPGRNGKTTTKELVGRRARRALGPVLKPERSFNNQWGLPLTLLRLSPSTRPPSLEIGTNARRDRRARRAVPARRSAS